MLLVGNRIHGLVLVHEVGSTLALCSIIVESNLVVRAQPRSLVKRLILFA